MAFRMSVFLRVITLNCWALPQPWPIGSKYRKYRIEKLVEALQNADYDVISLQELWSEKDYLFICNSLQGNYPYAHYFHSGFTGSGVCVISKHPIVSTLMHRGDWFGGKVVGLVLLEVGDFHVSFYTTHLHAEYNRANDLYLPHRLSQAFELSQFVKHTEALSDCTILTGDFNIEPEDLGYRLITNNAHLNDSWPDRPSCNADGCTGMTDERPDNCFTHKSALEECPEGKRLDYIMYKPGKAKIRLLECENRLGKIPDSKIDYSDHLGVYSMFEISEESTPKTSEKPGLDLGILNESIKIVGEGEMRALWDRRLFLAACVILLALIISTFAIEVHFSYFTVFATIARFFLTLLFGFSIWYGLIGLTMELKALKAAKLSMQQLLND